MTMLKTEIIIMRWKYRFTCILWWTPWIYHSVIVLLWICDINYFVITWYFIEVNLHMFSYQSWNPENTCCGQLCIPIKSAAWKRRNPSHQFLVLTLRYQTTIEDSYRPSAERRVGAATLLNNKWFCHFSRWR